MADNNAKYRWKFFRAGGLEQVLLRDGNDIAHLGELDPKLWTILSCPTRGILFDPKTMDLLDSDRDGRVRVSELLEGVKWTVAHLKNPDVLMEDSGTVRLSSINDSLPSGAKLLAGARRVLANLGKAGADAISLADIEDRSRVFQQTKFNGDGIIPEDSAQDPETRRVIGEIISCMGSETDRSGKPGISQAKLDSFLQEASAFSEWHSKAESDPAVLVLGAKTEAAVKSWQTVKSKIDDFFARCRVAEFDARAIAQLNRDESDYAAMARQTLSLVSPDIVNLPMARISPKGRLPLADGLNPAWAAAISVFRDHAALPLLGQGIIAISERDWLAICAKLSPFVSWSSEKAGAAVEKIGLARVREILSGSAGKTIARLILEDASLEEESAQIGTIEKLIRYHRDLNRLLHNFVNFSDFYDPDHEEVFRYGRLYIDGRACEVCFLVSDMAKHAMLAAAGKIFLAYCEIYRPSTGEKKTICAAVTAGNAGSLWVGRNGVFLDRSGQDWEAVIVKIVDHSISLREAFWSPWKKIAAMIGDQISKLMAAKEAAVMSAVSKGVDQTAAAAPAPAVKPAGAPKQDGAALASSVAAIGIAVGLLGSAVGGLVSAVSGLPLWKSLLGIVAVILVVSGPSMILAYFKLRARDLAPVLNACGFAVNGRIRMTMRLGREFTQEAVLPEGSQRMLTDPYADSYRQTYLVAIMAALLALAAWLWNKGWMSGIAELWR